MKTSPSLLHQNLTLLLILYSITTTPTASCSPARRHRVNPAPIYVTESCKTTSYPRLCNKTLSRHAERIKSSPKLLAMTALAATVNATRTTSEALRGLRRGGAAAAECVEVVGDAVYELRRAVRRLDRSRKGPQFSLQMNDVQTWVSAALTDDDTCLDDFTAVGRSRILVRGFVLTIARLTSISLTFINNYAAP